MRCPGSTIGTTVPARGGSSAQIRESTFGLLAFRRPPRAFSSGSARPPRAPDASGTPRPGSGLSFWHGRSVLLLRVGLLPGAETAAAGQAGSRLLGPAQGACSPPPMPAHAAHAAPHAHRPTQAQAPQPAHARRSRRRSRPSRAPCSRGQMRAQGRRASRRAPAGGAPSCCNGRSWPAERSLGGRATADGPPCAAAARTLGSLHRVRLERLCVC